LVKGKGKVIPVQAVEAHRVVRGRGSHIFRCFSDDDKVVSPICQPLLPTGKFLILISVRGLVDPRAIVRLEGLDKLEKKNSSGIRTSDLQAYGIVPQPTAIPRAPNEFVGDSLIQLQTYEYMQNPELYN
jgi:hypothetical protein